ncbi:MAG: hypothetical protein N2A99_05120 [Carnobacterium alterfunditum]
MVIHCGGYQTNKKKVNLIGWGNDARWERELEQMDRDEGREEEKKEKEAISFYF